MSVISDGVPSTITLLTYNVFGGGPFAAQRLPHLVAQLERLHPDVVCLQEATLDLLAAVVCVLSRDRTEPVVSVTKLGLLERSGGALSESEHRDVCAVGFLAVISAHPVAEARLVHKGGWLDDGIMCVDVAGVGRIYNVHLSGGSFGKPREVVEAKRDARRSELRALLEDVEQSMDAGGALVVCGDFNCDSNFQPGEHADPDDRLEAWPEVELLLDRVWPSAFVDAWEQMRLRGCVADGCTESASKNNFRAHLKPGQTREVRFDKVVTSRQHVEIHSACLVGTEQCAAVDDEGVVVPLFVSDHFGVAVKVDIKN